ncbi:hypothetical protein SAMN04487965_3262 [Microbulbifer donghaiensis]|uniref:Uncharacterized protein n=1 Tax=Microbulbifer donghaiensis TaxID=494016 RepID=A0A1M5GVK2_9GAMM|nr:hypothetical protein [Microbulbifer donghaiensis]SHG07462.1 hypothetical protein SAMN04487965_3262 [Microbulbifer donghaiensis]
MASDNSEKNGSSRRKPRIKSWFVILLLLTVGASYIYYSYQKRQEAFINTYYFRTLQDVAAEFNHGLDQLISLHKFEVGSSTILSIFGSYRSDTRDDGGGNVGRSEFCEIRVGKVECVVREDDLQDLEKEKKPVDEKLKGNSGVGSDENSDVESEETKEYVLGANRIKIIREDSSVFYVDISDVMPAPRRDFALYIIADANNRVLGSIGAASGLSIVDTEAVSREIELRQKQNLINLANDKGVSEPKDAKALPGFSSHIDLELTIGRSRLYILPFLLNHDVGISPVNNNDRSSSRGQQGEGIPLYLIGVQPGSVIKSYENKRWNLSLLLFSLVALVFLWTVTRLLMVSRHQALGNSFYITMVAASYLSFVMLVALLVAWGQRSIAVYGKQQLAQSIFSEVEAQVSRDLESIFDALDGYHKYYRDLLSQLNPEQKEDSSKIRNNCGVTGIPYCSECTDRGEEPHRTVLLGMQGKRPIDGCIEQADTDLDCHICSKIKAADPPEEHGVILPFFSKVNIFGPGTNVKFKKSDGQGGEVRSWFDIKDNNSFPAGGKLLTVFLMDNNGRQVLPMFYFVESNKPPVSFSLAHREYFRRVRDKAGWNGASQTNKDRDGGRTGIPCADAGDVDCSNTRENFYIQRLLNISTGTRGTTLGLPLRCGGGKQCAGGGYVLGADIEIPALSLEPPFLSSPESEVGRARMQDLIFMVVDRVTGQVLYHMDDKRSMVENLYHAGLGTAGISQLIRAGRIQGTRNNKRSRPDRLVSGYYHGQSGDFLARKLGDMSQWALVVFIPDDGTDSLMTNVFLASTTGIGGILLLLVCLLYLTERYCNSDALKVYWGLPVSVTRHSVMLFSTILLTSIFLGYSLGAVINQYTGARWNTSLGLSLAVMAIVLAWGYAVLRSMRERDSTWEERQTHTAAGTVRLLTLFLTVGCAAAAYLQHVGDKPSGAVRWHSEKLCEARLNKEQLELRNIALTRYPNSIKQHGKDPLSLLPISEEWRSTLRKGDCKNSENEKPREPHIMPEDVGTFSQYTASTGPLKWVTRYLFGVGGGGKKDNPDGNGGDRDASYSLPNLFRFLIAMSIAFLLLCGVWYLFYRKVIGARLVGSPGLIAHLQHIISHNVPERAYSPERGLVLDLHCRAHAGSNLTALLYRSGKEQGGKDCEDEEITPISMDETARRGIAMLLEDCPGLRREADEVDLFPGVNISFSATMTEIEQRYGKRAGDKRISVHLSDLDICLSRTRQREALLRLIRHLKSMFLAGQLAELRISLGFHSYEALVLKAHSMKSERDPMTAAEFAGWAETLMDFIVELPEDLTREVDSQFVQYECCASGLLRNLPQELEVAHELSEPSWAAQRRWLNLGDVDKTSREWASINWILLKAGALFRHKWESCSGAEKLALFFLAKKKRVNTANAQLLEQMALQGLIRVDHGRVRIINNSFAYFARHAEDTETLKQLVEVSEAGAWQDYRLPVTLLILLVLGGIAFTSGSSLYLIAATMLGLLGTIGSLTSSAKMIRENLR